MPATASSLLFEAAIAVVAAVGVVTPAVVADVTGGAVVVEGDADVDTAFVFASFTACTAFTAGDAGNAANSSSSRASVLVLSVGNTYPPRMSSRYLGKSRGSGRKEAGRWITHTTHTVSVRYNQYMACIASLHLLSM